ncbi:23S rRNA (guanosine2251-2'-O)-methyltransferase [Lutispora thermophila DSM 19022]|uniref:23S rRNA (Guanosine2251-2'-O)-methyltransferase n=2 Tax=Lutispora TaxID=667112 RepID=A0A1M6IAM9_9FIRM|nr:23S rRNA (guanosine2251-2'-O)-methyltransferase [Lutispora thermophila DSM 19022]
MAFVGDKRNKKDRQNRQDKNTVTGYKKDRKKAIEKNYKQARGMFEETDERDDYYINLIEGRNPVLEALKSGREIDKLFVQSGQLEGSIKQIIAIARDKNILIKEVDKAKLDKMSKTKSHQGVIASAALYKYYEVDDILDIAKEKGEDPFIVILDEITDPQNLGSILRSCDAAGVHGVIIPKRRAASLTPIIGKISAGAVEYVPVAKITNINQTMSYLKEKGLWIAGADASGETYYEKDLTGPLALVVGSEGKGLGRIVKENCDFIVGIPMSGNISSLNAAVSCAVLIFEAKKQRLKQKTIGSLQEGSIH